VGHWIGAYVRILVIRGPGQAVQAQSHKSLLQQEFEELVVGFIDHFFGDGDLPNVRLLEALFEAAFEELFERVDVVF